MKEISVQFKINGQQVKLKTQANRRLLDVLREDLGLTGAKEGCGTGDCGACSILVDGRVNCSCLMFAPEAEGRDRALSEALFSLQTWPTDTTLKPAMCSLDPKLKPPYPVYAAAWDNEYIWKGNLLQPDGWLSRIVVDVAVPEEDPVVIYAIDQSGGPGVSQTEGLSHSLCN